MEDTEESQYGEAVPLLLITRVIFDQFPTGEQGNIKLQFGSARLIWEIGVIEIPIWKWDLAQWLITSFNQEIRPQFILDVEVGELNINAGLQDRVVQVYEGLVYMDFSRAVMEEQGHGTYINMTGDSLPQVNNSHIAYRACLNCIWLMGYWAFVVKAH